MELWAAVSKWDEFSIQNHFNICIWSEQWTYLECCCHKHSEFWCPCQVIFWWLGPAEQQREGEYGKRADFSLCKVHDPSENSHKKRQKIWYQLTASWCCYKKSQTVKIYVSIIGFAESEATKVLQGWSLAAALNTRWEQWGGISTGITKMLRI